MEIEQYLQSFRFLLRNMRMWCMLNKDWKKEVMFHALWPHWLLLLRAVPLAQGVILRGK